MRRKSIVKTRAREKLQRVKQAIWKVRKSEKRNPELTMKLNGSKNQDMKRSSNSRDQLADESP